MCDSEPHKAYECFLEATHGASQEDFLLRVAHPSNQPSTQVANTHVLYYLKVSGTPSLCLRWDLFVSSL